MISNDGVTGGGGQFHVNQMNSPSFVSSPTSFNPNLISTPQVGNFFWKFGFPAKDGPNPDFSSLKPSAPQWESFIKIPAL